MKGEKIRKSVKVWPCSPFETLLEIPFLYLPGRCQATFRGDQITHCDPRNLQKTTVWFGDGFYYNDVEVSRGGDEPAGP